MKVKERVVLKMPPSVLRKNLRGQHAWARRAVRKAVWEARCRILEESGYDIFNVFVMTDCVEVTIDGEFDAMPVERKEKKSPGRPPGWRRNKTE